jgi:hypothetical protein
MNSSCLEFIFKICPSSHGIVTIDYFKDRKIAITANDFVRKVLVISTQQVKQKIDILASLRSDDDIMDVFKSKILNFIEKIISNNITAVFIFDKSLINAGTHHIINLTPFCDYLRTVCLQKDCRYITIIDSEIYAEEFAHQLVIRRQVNAVLSEEMSCIAYGIPLILKYADNNTLIWIQFDTILKESNLTHTQFIDFLIMCGLKRACTDVPLNNNMKGVGPVKSYKYICTNGNADYLLKVDKASCLNLSSLRDKFRH